jgi:hypothetical protein
MDITFEIPDQPSPLEENEEQISPVILEWKNKKINDICYCLATFLNYLAIPRTNFLTVKEDRDDPACIQPMIVPNMISYLIEEIYPCPNMIKQNTFIQEQMPNSYKHIIKSILKTYITNTKGLVIDVVVYRIIWTYINNSLKALDAFTNFEENIEDKLQYIERSAVNRNIEDITQNFGFNEYIENTAFQTIFYIIVALTDWLEIDTISLDEVYTAYKIIVPQDLQFIYSLQKNIPTIVDAYILNYENLIKAICLSRNLTPSDEAVKTIISFIHLIKNLKYIYTANIQQKEDISSDIIRILARSIGFTQTII